MWGCEKVKLTLRGAIQAIPANQSGVLKEITPEITQNRLMTVDTNDTANPREFEKVQKIIPTVSPQLC